MFGMLGIKNDRRRPILKIVHHRSVRHLLPLIKKHVRRGSSVISDGWRSYRRLQDEGYNHLTVNHQDFFVDPVTGERLPGEILGYLQVNYLETKREPHTKTVEGSLRCN